MKSPHRLFSLCLALITGLLTLGPSPALAARHALIVGVAKYDNPRNNLRFPEKDAAIFQEYLITQHGFASSEIHTLLSAQATAEAVNKELATIIKRTKPGDVLVFYFSGHGTQVVDRDGDEPNGFDEALCLHDSGSGGFITDDDLRFHLKHLKTDRCLVVLDCCHSGTGTRNAQIGATEGVKRIPTPFFAAPSQPVRGALPSAMKSIIRKDQKMNHLLIAGCAAEEVSYEHQGIGGGFVTQALVNQIRGDLIDKPIATAGAAVQKQVASWVNQYLPDANMQNVQLEGPLQESLRQLLRKNAPEIEVIAPPSMDPALAGAREVQLTLSTDKKTYRVGERMKVTVKADRDCHLRLYYTGADGVSYLIFPNKFQKQDSIKGGQEITLGDASTPFAFEMTFPKETANTEVGEILTAVASPSPFTDNIGNWGESQFIPLGQAQRGAFATRGVQVRQRPGYAVSSYLITR